MSAGAPRRLALLGATGSIGRSALSVVEAFPDRFRVVSMSAGRNVEALLPAISACRPALVSVSRREDAERLRAEFPGLRVGWGEQGLVDVATCEEADVVLGGVVGSAGLLPALQAVRLGKTLALANKEVLVVGGELVMEAARASGAAVLPVDSEHCALHQALRSGAPDEVRRLVLTASGGPFRTRPLDTFAGITVEDALAHPTWRMGPKITVDSATMMNKGLEVIEARWLFDVPGSRIDVVIHPQSIVHSMVEWVDGSVVAQLSPNDMRFPILYALTHPRRIETPLPRLDLLSLGRLDFAPLEEARYPAVKLAYAALEAGGSAPAALNAANEVAVAAFLDGRIPFGAVVEATARVLDRHDVTPLTTVEEALLVDTRARREAEALLPELARGSTTPTRPGFPE
ncbi:MAG: 1-deoxy-D-xylulose-5-phosphate reductoisomerase [Acidobacteria bacterium]|nr:MAG: 1-deoxy-D-xylulose-5-phosphate reductoisomerase [Acidobacteriota bacterium]MCE7959275.1 1-deoxy-D-xylulose-5-phosphate reductoisomerase [Acidobacteria bacterium ACB2]